MVKKAKETEVNFFDVYSTIKDIVDDQQRETIMKECLTDHELAPCPPFAIINPS